MEVTFLGTLFLFAKRFQTFFQKKFFCGSVGTDLSMYLVSVGVRSCISGSPYAPFKRKLLGIVVVVVYHIGIMS